MLSSQLALFPTIGSERRMPLTDYDYLFGRPGKRRRWPRHACIGSPRPIGLRHVAPQRRGCGNVESSASVTRPARCGRCWPGTTAKGLETSSASLPRTLLLRYPVLDQPGRRWTEYLSSPSPRRGDRYGQYQGRFRRGDGDIHRDRRPCHCG